MEGDLAVSRKKLKELDERKEFPCREKEYETLLDMDVFHYEAWSKHQDSVIGRASTPKIDVVVEFPREKPIVILALEYKRFVPTKKDGKYYRDLFRNGEINEDRLEKIAENYCKNIVKKFVEFCKEYKILWKEAKEVICFILLYPPKEKYEEFAKELFMTLEPFPISLLSREKGKHEFLARAKVVLAYEKLLDIASSKIKVSIKNAKCCKDKSFVGGCERLKRIISTIKT